MLIGYARVSTSDQRLDLQQDALRAAGCERVFTDTASGAKTERPGLVAALESCRAGDILVVWKLDRLGRSLAHLVETIQALAGRSVGFRSLQEQLDTTNAGLRAARARGRKGGRPKGVDEKKRKAALALKRDPQYTIREICEIVGISRNTYYKYTRTEEPQNSKGKRSPNT